MKILNSNWLRITIAAAISILIVSFLFYKIPIQRVISSIKASDFRLILLAVFISLSVNIFLGTEKWRRILRALGCSLSYKETLSIRAGCLPLKVIFPMKSSELLKVLYLNRQKKMHFGRGLSSLLLDKSLNLLVTLVIFFAGLSAVDLKISKVIPVSMLVVAILILFSAKVRSIFIVLSKKIHIKLYNFTAQLFSGFEEVKIKEKIILILFSIVYQLSEFINTYILFKAMGLKVPFSLILVMIPMVMIVNVFPVTILGLGSREAFTIFLFSGYGASTLLLSASLLITFIEHILPVLFGLFFIKAFIAYLSIKNARIS